jgi:DNA polymerase-4
MYVELEKIAHTVHNRLQRHNLKGRTVTVKIRYSDFKVITRNQSFPSGIDDLQTILDTARQLLAGTFDEDQKIRLLGISLHNFYEPLPRTPGDSSQLPLF